MRCLFTEVFLNTPTPSAQRISGIKDVKNYICAWLVMLPTKMNEVVS
jgi:hypothetical protein